MKTSGIFLIALFAITLVYESDAQGKKYFKWANKGSYATRRYEVSRAEIGKGDFKTYYFAGISINGSNYFGDLSPAPTTFSTDLSFTRPGIGIYGGFRFFHSATVRASINLHRIAGNDFRALHKKDGLYRYARNLSFKNNIYEFSLGSELFFLPNTGGIINRHLWNPYIYLGVAFLLHEPKAEVPDFDYQLYQPGVNTPVPAPQAGKVVNLRELQTEGVAYSNTAFAVPIAIGVQARVPRSELNIAFEIGLRYTFTDYLDDVSTNYVSLDQFGEDEKGILGRILSDRSAEPISSRGKVRQTEDIIIDNNSTGFYSSSIIEAGREGSKRGNPEDVDVFLTTSLKIQYLFHERRPPSARNGKYR